MLIRNGKAFSRGLFLLATFAGVFFLFTMPIFPNSEGGNKLTGLVFVDHLFNTLSKGSANFFDPTLKDEDSVDFMANSVKGKTIDIDISMTNAAQRTMAVAILEKNGMTATPSEGKLHIKGDLFTMLTAINKDSFSLYNNNDKEVAARYGLQDGRAIVKTWWQVCSGMIKPLQKIDMVDEAATVSMIMMKGLEPGYNFYGITGLLVKDNIPLVSGFLIFYVIYTVWYGYAIFEMFEGFGLSMKKGVKKEV